MAHFGIYHTLNQHQSTVSNISPINNPTSNGPGYSIPSSRTWERNVINRSSSKVRPSSIYSSNSGIQSLNQSHNPRSMHGYQQQSISGKYLPSVADALQNGSTQYLRPPVSLEICKNLQEKRSAACKSLSPSSSYARSNFSSSPIGKSNLNRAPLSSYPRTLAAEGTRFIPTKLSTMTASFERAFKISRIPQIKIPELTGWRAKLAQEGFISSADKMQASQTPPARKWHYINETDSLHDEENNLIIVVCQATQTEHSEEKYTQPSKTISRLRNMKLERQKPKMGVEIGVQANSTDIEKRCEAQKLRSLKKNFISSKYTTYYTEGFYNKYTSTKHSKPNDYQQFLNNAEKTKSLQKPDHSGVPMIADSDNRSLKSLNILRNTETEISARKYKEQQEESEKIFFLFSSDSSGEESSPIETGYESHSSDSSRSKFKFPKLQIPLTQTSYNKRLCESTSKQNLDAEANLPNTNLTKIQQEEHSFRFYSANGKTSQRDSGFLDIVNHCDSPYSTEINSCTCVIVDKNNPNFQLQNGTRNILSKNIDDIEDIDPITTLANQKQVEEETFKEIECELKGYRPSRPHIWVGTSCHSENSPATMIKYSQILDQFQNTDESLEIGPYFKQDDLKGDSELINSLPHQLLHTDRNKSITSVMDIKGIPNLSNLNEFENDVKLRNNKLNQLEKTNKLDDCTLQLYRYNSGGEGDYGSYLDLESTVDEQAEEFEGFHNNRKNAVILRTQLSVRVHAIVEKLVNSSGRELRRALFSLKQIFQDDKDLVHEFVQNDGLACLIKVGSEADQNYQNYILRALGQVMLYVDGMNGVIEHNETIQWLYSLIASKFRLVVKTALKLLLVFVEYTETNSQLLINAVSIIDRENGSLPWSNIMNLLKEKDSADVELLVYTATLINKTLNGVPDQDTYYDAVDTLEEQGIEYIIQYYMSKQGTDLDLLQQFHIYEAVLKHEDDIPDKKPLPLDARLRQVPRSRKSYPDENDRRKSRRHSVGTVSGTKQSTFHNRSLEKTSEDSPFIWHDRKNEESRRRAQSQSNVMQLNENLENDINDEVGTMALSLKRRRERDARNKSFIKEQEENGKDVVYQRMNNVLSNTNRICSENCEKSPLVIEETFQPATERRRSSIENYVGVENQKNGELCQMRDEKVGEDGCKHFSKSPETLRSHSLTQTRTDTNKKAWMFSMMYAKSQEEDIKSSQYERLSPDDNMNNKYMPFSKTVEEERIRDHGIKDMREKFNGHYEGSVSPISDNFSRLGDSSGIISRAKEGLAASTCIRSEPKFSSMVESTGSKVCLETKKLDSDLQWEQLMNSLKRPLIINDLDFTDLEEEEDSSFLPAPDYGSDSSENYTESCTTLVPSKTGPPPPPPPLPTCGNPVHAPPQAPAPPRVIVLVNNPQLPPPWIRRNQHDSQNVVKDTKISQKTKKTVKLFWREVKDDHSLLVKIGKKKTIWDELKPVTLDTQKLEHLFENRAKDIINKEKAQDCIKKSELIVLDTKRSNAINIGMTKLPPPRTIKTAILKMDSTIMNREGIEKILTTMLPTEDEKSRIAETQMANPDIPLGTAEQFLLTLSSISELEARLKLWAFRLDYDSIEKEVAEPLMDLKQAMKEIEDSETFRVILSTLRSVGNFLNGVVIKGFHIEYLSKVPEVKDTVQKHSLLHHLCHIVMEKFPKSTDLYSEIGSVTRASKVDYSEVARNLNKMESECKASWDYLKAIAKHDCSITMKVRVSEFLADCAERIIVLKVIHRRMINRYHKFLLYLGCINQSIEEMPVQKVCKILSEFALEFRTTRERVLQQIEKKANHRERNKTRGKMIIDMAKFRTKEQQADHELRQLLGNTNGEVLKWGTFPTVRGRNKSVSSQSGTLCCNNVSLKDEGLTDGDDEILETLVKTATAQPTRNEPKIRKKARYGDRKSLRRTLKNGLSDDEKFVLSSMAT